MTIEKIRCIRSDEVIKLTGFSRTTLWRLEKKGTFPKRRKISSNIVVWIESEVQDWLSKLPIL